MSQHGHVSSDVGQNQPGVLCVRCNHLNVMETATCKRCGAELYRECPKCGHSSPIVFANCRKCHKRFPRGVFGHRSRKLRKAQSFARRALTTAFQVTLVLAALAVAGGIIYLIADYIKANAE
jgi:ribosomal protein L40E